MKNKNKLMVNWKVLFYLYIIILSYFLFFSERYGRIVENTSYRYNLIIFNEIKRFIKYRQILGFEIFAVNILGNILAFSPFGFLVPLISGRKIGLYKIIALSFLFSLTIETIQLICRVGSFDVDDILLNTIGGILGYIIFKIFRKKLVKFDSKEERGNR